MSCSTKGGQQDDNDDDVDDKVVAVEAKRVELLLQLCDRLSDKVEFLERRTATLEYMLVNRRCSYLSKTVNADCVVHGETGENKSVDDK